jgi:hypothetical protein
LKVARISEMKCIRWRIGKGARKRNEDIRELIRMPSPLADVKDSDALRLVTLLIDYTKYRRTDC